MEKLIKYFPSHIDWDLWYEVIGFNGFGFKTFIDYWTGDYYKMSRHTIGNAMNLTNASKHLPFIIKEAVRFYDSLKPGQHVDFKEKYWKCFVDILFQITFGENVLTDTKQFDYKDPFQKRPTVRGNLVDLFERLLEDGYGMFYSFPYLIFP